MSRPNILLPLLLLMSMAGYGQTSKADRLFQKGDYIRAAQYYEEALNEKKSQRILEQLSDCYYNTYQYEKGLGTMKALVNQDFMDPKGTLDAKYHFMYYQFLMATGDYEKAIDQLVIYRKKVGQNAPDIAQSRERVETFRLKKADFEIKKVAFNSEASDYGAIKKNDSVYFSSDREGGSSGRDYRWTHRPFLDIYVLPVDGDNQPLGEAAPLPQSINSELHEGSLCFGKDGHTMYFSRSNLVDGKRVFNKEGKNQIQIYASKKIGGQWTSPQKLPFCSDEYNYHHPSLSGDGKTLYYASDEEGSLGSYDIYKVEIGADGSYGSPINLGQTINTSEREQFPYISDEGHLYFASNGHLGLGLLDIFVAPFENGSFQEPINLGAPINSRYDDIALSYENAVSGFFSSNRDGDNDDIFAFTQIGDLFSREYANFFKIEDSLSRKAVPNAKVTLRDGDGIIGYENTLGDDGNFSANLIPGKYELEVESPGYGKTGHQVEIQAKNNAEHLILVKKRYDIDAIAENISEESKQALAELFNDRTPPRVINQNGKLYFDVPYIYFDFDRWNIREDSKMLLNNLVHKLNEYPDIKIRINSHTDNRGSYRYNMILSEKRAQATRDYLVKNGGIATSRISFKGYGESKPLVDCEGNCSEKDHEKNRRSQFEIVEF